MLQIVTLRHDYQHQIAHPFIINSTEGATQFNNFVVLNALRCIQQTTKYLTDDLKTHLIHE